jgi:hypothetical protein
VLTGDGSCGRTFAGLLARAIGGAVLNLLILTEDKPVLGRLRRLNNN